MTSKILTYNFSASGIYTLYFSSDCASATFTHIAGGILSPPNDVGTISVQVNGNTTINVAVNYDFSLCGQFTILVQAYDTNNELCNQDEITIYEDCYIPEITASYDCLTGLDIVPYNVNYDYNPPKGTFLPAGTHTVQVTDPTTLCYNLTTISIGDCCDDINTEVSHDCVTGLTIETFDNLSNPLNLPVSQIIINPPSQPNPFCTSTNPICGDPANPCGSTPIVITPPLCNGNYNLDIIVEYSNGCTQSVPLNIDCGCDCMLSNMVVTQYDNGCFIVQNSEGQVFVNGDYTTPFPLNTEVCLSCEEPLDVIFVQDRSGSQTPYVEKANQSIIGFLNSLDIENKDVNVGFASFGADIIDEDPFIGTTTDTPDLVPLGDHSISEISTAILPNTSLLSNTCSTQTLLYALNQFMVNGRDYVPKYLFFMTDGCMNACPYVPDGDYPFNITGGVLYRSKEQMKAVLNMIKELGINIIILHYPGNPTYCETTFFEDTIEPFYYKKVTAGTTQSQFDDIFNEIFNQLTPDTIVFENYICDELCDSQEFPCIFCDDPEIDTDCICIDCPTNSSTTICNFTPNSALDLYSLLSIPDDSVVPNTGVWSETSGGSTYTGQGGVIGGGYLGSVDFDTMTPDTYTFEYSYGSCVSVVNIILVDQPDTGVGASVSNC